MPNQVTAAILTWNRRECVISTVRQLRERDILDIIVVDNGSTDGTLEALQSRFSDIQIIRLESNVGTSGWNAALEVATTPFVFLLDDDSTPVGDAAERGIRFLEDHPKVGVVACGIRNLDGRREPVAHFSRPGARFAETSHFIGCGALVRREVLKDVPGFDKRIFLYQHELDFALGLLRHRWRIAFLPDLEVLHRMSGVHRTTYRKAYFGMRNTLWTLFKHLPRREALARMPSILVIHLVKYSLEARRTLSLRPLFGVLRGAVDALVDLPDEPHLGHLAHARVLRDPMIRKPLRTAVARWTRGRWEPYDLR